MKRILFIFSMLFCFSALADAQVSCNQGDQDPIPDPEHPQDPIDDTSTSGGISADPNEIIGPTGYDDSLRWVSINDVLNYTIFFENDPDFATANAQKVDVRFNFADKAAMKGFGLGTYGFANQSWNIDDAPAAYQNRLDLRDSMYIYVDLTAGIDVVKQQAFWLFNSIDPETGYNPWQVDRGMLPVNDSTHVGEGFVTFRLKPHEGLKTGDTISIVASIVFDQNDTIPTNRWRNTIDAGNPTSKVKARQDSKNEHLYHLTLEAADDEGGSGLKRVLLYQANNFGIYEEVATCPVDTVIDFTAEPGHQYRFNSIAEDNVGNREPLTEQPDLVININAAPTDIALSDSTFQDDIAAGGFIAELTSEDIEEGGTFTYALAEGDSAIHNDLFLINGTQLLAKQQFKCAEDSIYQIRLSTTDEGGLSFSKAFKLDLRKVLIKPDVDTLTVSICEGETCIFQGVEYDKTGTYHFSKENEFMCDSLFVLNLTVLPRQETPLVTVEGSHTLVSSAAKGNQWYKSDGTPIEDATDQKFTPTEDGIYYVAVSNGSCYSEPSKFYRVQLTDNGELAMNLVKGWNWISSNLATENMQQPLNFLEPIQDEADQLISFSQGLINDAELGWIGNLNSLNATDGYKLHVTEDVAHTWSGLAAAPENTPITLYKGWTWIGYVPTLGKDLNDALSGLQASEGDVVKGFDNFAVYEAGEWVGTLQTMQPGEGYMYQAQQEHTLTYSPTRVFEVDNANEVKRVTEAPTAPWTAVTHDYVDNMTLIAQVFAGGSIVPEGLYTIGAFVGDECRGIGQYVNDKLFMTIHDNLAANSTISFRAFNNATREECGIVEYFSFQNVMKGSMKNPYALHIDTTDRLETLTGAFNIYPNPVRDRFYINGNTDAINTIMVISSSGANVLSLKDYPQNGVDVTGLVDGIYIVVLTTSQGDASYKIVKRK